MPRNIHKALVVGIQDIRYPIHGSARLTLAVLHALALNNHKIHYLTIDINNENRDTEVTNVLTESRFGVGSITMIKIRRLRPLIEIPRKLPDYDYDYVLCLDRRYITLCKALSKKLNIPLITYMDSPPYLHPERLTTIKDHVIRPIANLWYAFIGYMSDITICVSKYIEEYLSSWGVKAMTAEPTYALLHKSNDPLNNESNDNLKVNEIENAIFCSCPTDLTLLIALKLRETPIVVTGPSAYYIKEYLKSRGMSIKNLYLLHNISDSALKTLHNKVILSLIARPALAGISITLIQELYFGKAILTDSNTAKRIQGLSNANAVIINDNYTKWPQITNEIIKKSNYLKELEHSAKQFFDNNLSPTKFAISFENALHSIDLR